MTDVVSHLFQVTVSGPGGTGWKVLVRSVDAESAAGAVRARGHNVAGVQPAEMPKRSVAPPRISCLNCGYLLKQLPVGDAGEVQCPECGVINTPSAEPDSILGELKAVRAELKRQRAARGPGLRLMPTLAGLAVFAVGVLLIRSFLRWMGWLP